ncbi:DUF1819 family protein [Levilactobacillus namurensis]|uniref:DUF1819 family protein n=1 Tax=Levilactobacillus namurensis TaxID=380393 RepID=UPI00222FD32F|nr:DUF1819 family protein [Levilactobacillus namurensis]MCW3779302.1 DUF1819 family protein [Levilactobacillus namurensis]MDT7019850.1 DUF1819 family protein [Levilactobacillus namurensis]WNN65567.1 DUF1819 family protein [Levilactobacillus namurensis]
MPQYSATLIGYSFWFREFSQYLALLDQGVSPTEIREMGVEDNYFQEPTTSRAVKMLQSIQRRVETLDADYRDLFPQLDLANQKLLNLLTVMFSDPLFNDFMYDVYRSELLLGDAKLHAYEVEAFFNQKQLENPQIAHWTLQTVHRLASAFQSFLREAGLLENHGDYDAVQRALLDTRLMMLLRAKHANRELASLLGR